MKICQVTKDTVRTDTWHEVCGGEYCCKDMERCLGIHTTQMHIIFWRDGKFYLHSKYEESHDGDYYYLAEPVEITQCPFCHEPFSKNVKIIPKSATKEPCTKKRGQPKGVKSIWRWW